MDRFAAFHASHFEDPARRAWFAAHMMPVPPSAHTREELEDTWTTPAYGETDAQWQARHGLAHLTPGAARMFDQSRRFRAQRAAADTGAKEAPDLDALRAQALAALHEKRQQKEASR